MVRFYYDVDGDDDDDNDDDGDDYDDDVDDDDDSDGDDGFDSDKARTSLVGRCHLVGRRKYGRILPLWALQAFCAIILLPLMMMTILIFCKDPLRDEEGKKMSQGAPSFLRHYELQNRPPENSHGRIHSHIAARKFFCEKICSRTFLKAKKSNMTFR